MTHRSSFRPFAVLGVVAALLFATAPRPSARTSMTLGNLVWFDTNNNGIVDLGEQPFIGVQVLLHLDNGDGVFNLGTDPQIDVLDTGAGGEYRFGVYPGTYFVRIPGTQFAAGQPLFGYRNSTGQFPGDAANNRDHGVPGAGQDIISELVTMSEDEEPIDDGDTDPNTNLTIDFGFYKLSLGDLVFDDNDNSGTFNAGDAPRGGVNVELLDGAGVVLQTTVTDASGLYSFTGLESGDYRVRITPPTGFSSSTGPASAFEPGPDPDNNVDNDDNGSNTAATITSAPITLTPGAEPIVIPATGETRNPTVDFGLIPSLAIGDLIWYDTNNNGLVDAGELPIAGVDVSLYLDNGDSGFNAATDTFVATQSTSGAGLYRFSGLAPGSYFVQVPQTEFAAGQPLAGYRNSAGQFPGDANNNRDHGAPVAGQGVLSELVTLTLGGEPIDDGDTNANTNLTIDFGFYKLSLGDLVFDDNDNSGTFNAGDAPRGGVNVELLDGAGVVLQTTVTDASGLYLFTGLESGDYRVRITPPTGFSSSTGSASAFEPGPDPDNNVDNDDNGSNTAATITSAPITLTPGAEPIVTAATGETRNPTVDFGLIQVTLSLGNFVWLDNNNDGVVSAGEPGLDGVTVRLLSSTGAVLATQQTAGGGFYLFPGLAAGDYVVEVVTPAGYASSSGGGTEPASDPDNDTDNDDNGTAAGAVVASLPVTLSVGGEPTSDGDGNPNSNLTVDFGFVPTGNVSLGNLVWLDLNNNGLAEVGESGIQGVTVRLIAANGTSVIATTTTDVLGLYLFGGLTPGTYFVEVDRTSAPLTGYLSSTDIATSADPDNNVNNDDNGALVTATTVRSGAVTLTLLGEPIDDGDADNNSNLSVDFGFVRALSLGNLVWADANNDARVDPGETGIGGVTLRLIGANGSTVLATTTTDANGFYLFSVLQPGGYYVEVVPPPGGVSSTDIGTSANPNNDEDNDDNGVTVTATGLRSGLVTLGIGTEPTTDGDGNPDSNLTVDFGFVPGGTLSLGNLVWLDLNNNGVADAGEPGAPGVTVRLIAAGGTTVLSTTTTNAVGNYLFTNLPAGTYIVEVDRLSSAINGYLSSTDIASSSAPDNDQDNDDNGVNVTTATVRSNPVTLTPFGEPVTDGDADSNSNLTIDFGFVRTVSLGNLVWVDTNNNALVDSGERGRAGVTVRLLAADCVTVLATAPTDVNGNYLFSGLLPGTYCVSVVQPLGLQSSTDISSSANPNNDRNNDDNGVVVSAGLVRSGPVTLGFGLEPVDDGDTNPDSNLSVDFGFVPEQGGGFLADVCLGQTIPLSVVAGSPFTATFTADNRGPGVAENVVIDGMLPPGLTAIAAAPSAGGACTITTTAVDCLWPGGTPAGISRTVVVTFRTAPTAAPGSVVWLWFMSHSSNADPNPACDVTDSYVFVNAPSTPSADLVLTATGTSDTQSGAVLAAAVNSPVSARFTVTNTGAVPARGRYALLLDTASGIEVTAATATRGWIGVGNATAGTWETEMIPPGGNAVLDIAFVPRSGTMWRIQAIRTEGAPADPNAANDTAQVTIDGVGAGGGRFVAAGNLDGVSGHEIVTGAGQGETPQVQVFSGAGSNLFRFFAFDPGFRGGVRVASCDINGDGVDELIAAQGPGGGRVRVLSLAAGYVAETVAFDPFEAGFTGGINVACGDADGDGRAEVVVGPEGGRAPDVKVYAVGPLSAVVSAQFQAYEPTFTGGVRVSVGRFAGSSALGAFNIATTPGPGRAVEVRLWLAGGGSAAQVFGAALYPGATGARVVLGDVNGDGGLDAVVAPDGGTPMLVRAYSLSTGAILLDAPTGSGGYRSVNVAIGTFGGQQELVVGRGPGEPPTVGTFRVGAGGAVSQRLGFAAFEVP